MSLLLTLNRFHTSFWYFHCWLWTSKYRVGSCLRSNRSTADLFVVISDRVARDFDRSRAPWGVVLATCEIQSIYVGKWKCFGDLTVSKFASAIPLYCFCQFHVETLKIYLGSLAKLMENIPSQKCLSEVNSITNFCFYLTFAMKYHFCCMNCCHLDCFFMLLGYLSLRLPNICKKVVENSWQLEAVVY